MKKAVLSVLLLVATVFSAVTAGVFAISANADSADAVILTHTNQDVLEKNEYTYFYKNSCIDDSYSLLRIMSAGPDRTLDVNASFAAKDVSDGQGEFENKGLFLTFYMFFNYDRFYGTGLTATAGIYSGGLSSSSGITLAFGADFAKELTAGMWNKIALPISSAYEGYSANALDATAVDAFKFSLVSANNEIATSFLLSCVSVEKLDLPDTAAAVVQTFEYKGDYPNLNNALTNPTRDAVNFPDAERQPLPEPAVNEYNHASKSSNAFFVSSVIVCAVAVCVSVAVIFVICKNNKRSKRA